MSGSSAIFQRSKNASILQNRVELILEYVIHCFLLMLKDKRQYPKGASMKKAGKYHLETFLSKRFVDDYLTKNIEYFKKLNRNEPNVLIYFNNESSQVLKDGTDDFIDIQINESKLSSLLENITNEQVHFAIECKIIKNGYSEYVSDIYKFCHNNHKTFRLPFEGQIAYVLNSAYTNDSIVKGINRNIRKADFKTIHPLEPYIISESYDASYLSKHLRIYNNSTFSIFHLFLNYSDIIY